MSSGSFRRKDSIPAGTGVGKRGTLLWAALLLIFLPPLALAEEEISFERALELFYQNNYDVLIGQYEVDKAYADFVGAKLLPNPTFSVNDTGLDTHNFPNAGPNSQLTFRIDQLIELGGKRGLRTDASRETHEAARLTHKDTIRTLLIGFYNACYGARLDRLNRDAAREELKRFDGTLEIARKRYEAGHLSLVDYTKMNNARIDFETGLTNAENQLRNDGEQIGFLVGSDNAVLPKVALREDFPEPREEDLAEAAYRNRFDLLSLERQKKAAGYNQDLANSQRIPDVTVGAEYEMFGTGYTPGVGLGLSLNLPLFNRNQGEIARRAAEYRQVDAQIAKARRQIVLDVRQGLNNFGAAKKVFSTYRTRLKEMEDHVARSEKAFALGGITVLDWLDTQKTYRDFLVKYNQALVQANLTGGLLKIYTGEIK